MGNEYLERIASAFKSSRSREVGREDFVEALAGVFGLTLLRGATQSGDKKGREPAHNFSTNEEFWSRMLSGKLHEGSSIRLEGFHIMEWTPTSPGRYFTPEATAKRENAREFVSRNRNEYLPLGKQYMMLGGIGSCRLKGRIIDGNWYSFLGASSTGISHQGVPLIVPEAEHSLVVDLLATSGGCYCNIVGQLRVMPPKLSLIQYKRNIPNYFLFVQSIDLLEPSPNNVLLATASVIYSGSYDWHGGREESFEMDGFTSEIHKGWTFCSFNPSKGTQAVVESAEWLSKYAERHGGGSDPILSDFDEHHCHFDNPIEFPLDSIIDGHISLERLRIYGQHYGFQIVANEVNVIQANIQETKMEKILFVSADPSNQSHLRIQKEHRLITQELQMSIGRDGFAFETHLASRPSDLSRALLKKPRAKFLHFSGHGMQGTGQLCLEDEAGQTKPVSAKAIASLIDPLSSDLSCVVLNACYSEAQAKAMLDHVDFVVGMNAAIGDEAAIAYSVGFYQAIFNGESVPTAHNLGCAQIHMTNEGQQMIPTLLEARPKNASI